MSVSAIGGRAATIFTHHQSPIAAPPHHRELLTGLIASALLHMPVDYARIDRHQPDAPEYLPAGFDASLASHGPLIRFYARPGTYRIERVRLWQESLGAAISLIALLGLGLLNRRRRISHLSKFPSYSPSQALSDRPSFGRLRSRITGGDL